MKKRIISILAVAVMAFALVACSDEEKSFTEIKMSKYVKLADYENLTVDVELAQLEEYEYGVATEEFFRNICEPVGIKDVAVKNGDWVNIDYSGFKGEEQFAGGTATDQLLKIGSDSFIDGFEDGLIGVMPGEEVALNLTFPENYMNAELAGAEVVFKVTVNYIVPELTDENMEKLNSELYKSKSDLEAYVRETLDEAVLETNRTTITNAAMTKINNESVYKEIPEFMIEKQRAQLEAQYGPIAADYGIQIEQYFEYVKGIKIEDVTQQYVKERILLMALAQDLGIEVTEEEYNTGLEELAASQNVTVEKLLETYAYNEDYFREYFHAQRVYDYLYENVKIAPETIEETSEAESESES